MSIFSKILKSTTAFVLLASSYVPALGMQSPEEEAVLSKNFQNPKKSSIDIQNHIQNFYDTAMNTHTRELMLSDNVSKEEITKNALKFIEDSEAYLQAYPSSFRMTDLFMTTFETEYGKFNFIMDYLFNPLANPDIALFRKVVSFIDNVDAFTDPTTNQTLLMRLADDSLRGSERTAFAEVLLAKGASLTKQESRGFDALTLALYSGNKPMIRVFERYVKENSTVNLLPLMQRALSIYHGKTVDLVPEEMGMHKLFYRIANQAQNENMVQKLENESPTIKQAREMIKTFLKKNTDLSAEDRNFVFEPFWSYNAIEFREYADKIYKQLSAHFIRPDQLKEMDGIPYLTLEDGEIIRLFRKDDHVGRVLGRDYLAEKLSTSYKDSNLAVPRKFILPKEGQSTIKFTLPYQKGSNDLYVDPGTRTDNPMSIDMEGSQIYAEYIPDSEQGAVDANSKAIRAGAATMGLTDWGGKNAIISKNDGKIYLIDTDTDKNFIPSYFKPDDSSFTKNLKNITVMKSMKFDPRVKTISVTVRKDDNRGK